MTQAYNLSQLANFVNSSGQLDASTGLFNSPIPSGTVMSFFQASAPTGWVQVTTHNNKAIRIVSGTGGGSGGSVGFTTAFSTSPTGSATLTTSQIPSHGHNFRMNAGANSNQFFSATNYLARNAAAQFNTAVDSFDSNNTVSIVEGGGSGGSHSHTLNLAVQYIDMIIATKS